MEITEVRVFPVNEEKLKAYATVTFDDCFVVRDLKVIHGNTGLFVAMPSKKRKDGTFKDIAHPLNNEFRAKIEKVVLACYDREKDNVHPHGHHDHHDHHEPLQHRDEGPKVESKTPDQIKPEDYAAPDD